LLSSNQPEQGLEYILKAARFNHPSAQCLIASFQLLLQVELIEIEPTILSELQQYDTRYFQNHYSELEISESIRNIYHFSIAVKRGIEDGRDISFEYFVEALGTGVFGGDINEAISEMYRKFPDTERKKTLLLAQNMRMFGSGDKVCEEYTEALLTNSVTPGQKMLTKLQKFQTGESKLSEQNIRSCLLTFLRNSPKLQGQVKKDVTAIKKMHWHHGDGSHKGKDEVDGGRQKTVIQGFEAMIQATEQVMSEPKPEDLDPSALDGPSGSFSSSK
jgi:hypothetical protein